MRPQQQNRRMRGRSNNNNNNNRRGPNPLTRTYESNGPDVKIRGTAQQIAEKYATLARDAQSSGDRVMAENYLQHAEHYNRIIAAAQAQMPIQNVQPQRSDFDDDIDEDADEFAPQPQAGQSGQPHVNGAPAPQPPVQPDHADSPQPVIEGVPAEVALTGEAGTEAGGEDRQPRANGLNQAEGDAGGRRARRPRRGRGRPANEGAEAEAQGSADGGGQGERTAPEAAAPQQPEGALERAEN